MQPVTLHTELYAFGHAAGDVCVAEAVAFYDATFDGVRAGRAVKSGAATSREAENLIGEQHGPSEQGVFAHSVFFLQALGIKRS